MHEHMHLYVEHAYFANHSCMHLIMFHGIANKAVQTDARLTTTMQYQDQPRTYEQVHQQQHHCGHVQQVVDGAQHG
jgi:hypothetical protein